MKKKILTLLLTVTALGVIPFSVYVSETDTAKENECNEVITNQKIINEKNPDGTITQAGLVTFEYQPSSSDLKAGGCSSGHHTNIVNNGTPDTTRIHGKPHPGYCQVKTTTYWRCTNCNTTGHDDKYTLVWCPSADISGDEPGNEPGLQ